MLQNASGDNEVELAAREEALQAAKKRKLQSGLPETTVQGAGGPPVPQIEAEQTSTPQVRFIDAKKDLIPDNWGLFFNLKPEYHLAQLLIALNQHGKLAPSDCLVSPLPIDGSCILETIATPEKVDSMTDFEHRQVVRHTMAVLWSDLQITVGSPTLTITLKIPKSVEEAMSQLGAFKVKMQNVFKAGPMFKLFEALVIANVERCQFLLQLRQSLPDNKRRYVDAGYYLAVSQEIEHVVLRDWPANFPLLEAMLFEDEVFKIGKESKELKSNAASSSTSSTTGSSSNTSGSNNGARWQQRRKNWWNQHQGARRNHFHQDRRGDDRRDDRRDRERPRNERFDRGRENVNANQTPLNPPRN